MAAERELSERWRVSLPAAALPAALAAVAAAVTGACAAREEVLRAARAEGERALAAYVSRVELLEARQADREALRARLDALAAEMRVGFRRLELVVERLRR